MSADLRKAAQAALEYIEAPTAKLWPAGHLHRITINLRAALAAAPEQQAQEPVGVLVRGEGGAWHFSCGDHLLALYAMPAGTYPLYTAAPEQQAEPVAALIRSRHVTTWPHAAIDGKTHYSEWGEWLPATYKHAKAVTDPSRNTDPLLYEMTPLYAAAPPPAPIAQPQPIEALKELVALKDLKERIADMPVFRHDVTQERLDAEADYARRKPAAWAAARAVLAAAGIGAQEQPR